MERWTSPAGKQRLLVRMDPVTAARYARAARLAVPRATVGPSSYGSARRPDRPPPLASELRAWRAALVRAAEPGAVAETGDVAACYPSIGDRGLRAAARASGGDPEPLLSLLRDVHALGVTGLPVGPVTSSYLADAVLAVADLAAARAGVLPMRWVDDVVFVGGADAVARAAQAWRATLTELGLTHHEGKRRTGLHAWVLASTARDTSCTIGRPGRGIIRL